MKVAVIGTVGVPANYGGFETLVDQLIRHKTLPGLQYTVFCSDKAYAQKLPSFEGAELKYIPLEANGMQSIPYDILSLIKATRDHDVILMLGVSGASFLPFYRLFSKKKLVINIDGLEHRRDKWSPWIRRFLKFSEKMAIKYGDEIVTDNQGITDYVTQEYGRDSHLIAYGGDHAGISQTEEHKLKILAQYGLEPSGYSFALCRIEPENNVETILEAFSRMPEENLVFVGNWNKSAFGQQMREKYSKFPNIRIHDAIYDLEVLQALRSSCRYYLHGHSAGGTNPSLVEAMFFEVPIVAFDVVYNRETTESKALYFSSADSLIDGLQKVTPEELKANAAAMREIAGRRYTWATIASQYEKLY